MKKILLLTKTLLAVALLCVGQNAWAGDVTTLYEKGTTGHEWTSSDIASSGNYVWGGNAEITTKGYPYVSGNGGRTSSMTIDPSSNVMLTVNAVWFTGGDGNNASNYTYFRIGNNLEFQAHTTNQTGNVVINGTSYVIENACGKNNGNRTDDEWTIHAVINTATKELTTLTLTGKNGTSKATYTLASPVSLGSDATFTSMTFGTYREKYSPYCGIVSLSISEETQDVSSVDYTVNYKLGDDVVKTVSETGVVDQVITADAAIDGTEDGFVGNHYLITAASAPTMTLVSGTNVLDVPVRAPYTATLNVTTTIGTNEPQVVVTNLVETDAKDCSWSYAYPLYVKSGDVYYKADNVTTFGEGGVFTDGQVINKSVTYSTAEEDVVFFYDQPTPGTNYAYSNGTTGVVAAQMAKDRGISVGTLDAGTYSFVVNITAANRRSLGIRQSTNDHIASVGTSNEDKTTGVKSANFTLNAETSDLYINGANSGDTRTNQSEDFDYVIIKKLPSSVSKTITAAGWATYCSPYALDLEHATGLTNAYIVTGATGNVLNTTSVKNGTIPANTGILIEAPEGTVTIPVVASSSTDVAANKLVGVTANTNIAANEGYVLMAEPSLGFYQNANEFTVGANTAYLPASFASGARSAYFFGGEITGVANVEAAAEAKAQDGKFIENGKIVIVKNGVKYNAAGQQVK